MSREKQQKIREQISELVKAFHDLSKNKKTSKKYIPVTGKVLDHNELDFMVQASLDGWLTAGKYNNAFEKKLAKFLGVKFALTVNSGSSANLLAFTALTSSALGKRAVRPGDEVITVAAGFPTTINPIIQNGCVPVFVDIDETHNVDVDMLDQALSSKTRAIMVAHSLGNPFNLERVKQFCDSNNLWLIEDTCDALGSKFSGQNVGTFGDIATLSFYPAHHITMGEGGCVYTDNEHLEKIIKSFRDWGRDCYCLPGKDNTCGKRFGQQFAGMPDGYDHKYIYSHIGYNLKITDMQAACGLAQLQKLDDFIRARKRNYKYLYQRLQKFDSVFDLPKTHPKADPSWFGFPILIKDSSAIQRKDLVEFLENNGIGTRLLFAGNVCKQPSMSGVPFRTVGELPNTDKVMRDLFWVGVHPGIQSDDIDYMIEQFDAFFGRNPNVGT